ncbi:hypothetical protein IMZ48_05070 [Candidatus Bathyarchaeota archaeon]|nr:hypothetical protein [Candidatus Bathyarchaeota archaeon]
MVVIGDLQHPATTAHPQLPETKGTASPNPSRDPATISKMPSSPTGPPGSASNSGIITDTTGERHIPPSTRADGTTRKPIRIRPGYRPPEDVELYKNRTAEAFRERGKRVGIPGAAAVAAANDDDQENAAQSAASNKNAKRREARKKAKATVDDGADEPKVAGAKAEEEEAADPEVERQKKARGLKKKLKQAKDLKSKKEDGETLLPEQIAKVIKMNELIRELDALGFDAEGEQRGGEAADKEAKK